MLVRRPATPVAGPGLAAIPPYRCDAEGGSPTRWGAAGVRSRATTSVRPRGHPSVSMRRGGFGPGRCHPRLVWRIYRGTSLVRTPPPPRTLQ